MATPVNAGITMDLVDKQESRHHKRSKHSKHSRHSHRKSKHRHRKHHRRHHKKSHGKHHRHRAKLRIDEQALQSALESLEVDALDSIRMEVCGVYWAIPFNSRTPPAEEQILIPPQDSRLAT